MVQGHGSGKSADLEKDQPTFLVFVVAFRDMRSPGRCRNRHAERSGGSHEIRASNGGGAAIVAPVELIGNVAAGLIAAGLLVYLVFVLIRPERF